MDHKAIMDLNPNSSQHAPAVQSVIAPAEKLMHATHQHSLSSRHGMPLLFRMRLLQSHKQLLLRPHKQLRLRRHKQLLLRPPQAAPAPTPQAAPAPTPQAALAQTPQTAPDQTPQAAPVQTPAATSSPDESVATLRAKHRPKGEKLPFVEPQAKMSTLHDLRASWFSCPTAHPGGIRHPRVLTLIGRDNMVPAQQRGTLPRPTAASQVVLPRRARRHTPRRMPRPSSGSTQASRTSTASQAK
ncbi:hypothetical protein PGTUg99_000314 [Puccinia graminis f. sp. tritici]|uniref:Uncharacterized protein n=1 Tax=Puccinia graminis f. sp. tritici TaxID=56615 RepID=A0A5B0NLY6_PUCGR|nr:hypothetical protein PGTUg99_000314 [Puccinia graminis f. sp. tritici]